MTFQSIETVTKEQSIIVRSDPNDPNSPLVPNIVLGTITSNLLVVNAQYPDHNGAYTCTRSNDNLMINISSAMINVQVIGKCIYGNTKSDTCIGYTYYIQFCKAPPEVQVVASPLQVILGGSTTLFCNVTRTNPGIVGAYIWRNENTGERILENSNTLLLNLSVVTDYGTYSCMVTNSAGEVGRGNVTITKQEGN